MSDNQLHERVRLFGGLLGNILQAQAGDKVFEAVETLRKGYIDLREHSDFEKSEMLSHLIADLDPESITHVVRAFSTYFSLVNIAEESYQHRERRQQVHQGDALWHGSFDKTLREFRDQGISEQQLQILLNRLAYIPVMTAHPTESKRRIIMEAFRRVFLASERVDNPNLSEYERLEIVRDLEAQIQILWKTDEVRVKKPTVADELKNGIYYFEDSLFDAVCTTYRYLEKAIDRVYGEDGSVAHSIRVPSFIHFGSWIGGDRDGNPNVKPHTTVYAMRTQSRSILGEYIDRVTRLSRILSHSSLLCQPSEKFLKSLESDDKYAEAALGHIDRFRDECYRRKLYVMRYRLQCNLKAVKQRLANESPTTLDDAYPSENEFLEDLHVIHRSLVSHGDGSAANGQLKDLARLVETFGFFMAQLDIRQESTRHTEAVAEIITQYDSDLDYLSLDESSRLQVLARFIEQDKKTSSINRDVLSEPTTETLDVFGVMVQMRKEISPRAFGCYVISMTHTASNVMEVMWLAYMNGLAGLRGSEWFCYVNVSPLFETIEDLSHIEPVMNALFDDPTYTTLLKSSGNLQEVMLGYSDSCKDGGILSSVWSLYEAQKKVIALAQSRSIDCRLFHGRGGTIGRGGGPTHDAILSQPSGTVLGQIKITEQGEMLSSKYSNVETAVYELSLGVTGLMKSSTSLIVGAEEDNNEYLEIMSQLANSGEDSYRDLTDHQAGFFNFFYETSPVTELGYMNLGSRPSHRKKGDPSKSSIRAIPWVFGWAQSRYTLPAWYGIGSALEELERKQPEVLGKLKEMNQQWPFFRALVSNTQMALFKANMEIAKEYSGLCEDKALAHQFFQQINEEFEKTVAGILNITGTDRLLGDSSSLEFTLHRRDPYLDPLNHIQIVLLERCRDESLNDEERQKWVDPLLRSINAIASGMRNTG